MNPPPIFVTKIIRWTARMLTILALIFHMLSFLGDRWSVPLPAGDIVRLVLWGILLVAMILAWKWERLGGLVLIGGFVLQVGFNPSIVVMWAMWIAPTIGCLFLISSTQERNPA
jgi:hypothetical protein